MLDTIEEIIIIGTLVLIVLRSTQWVFARIMSKGIIKADPGEPGKDSDWEDYVKEMAKDYDPNFIPIKKTYTLPSENIPNTGDTKFRIKPAETLQRLKTDSLENINNAMISNISDMQDLYDTYRSSFADADPTTTDHSTYDGNGHGGHFGGGGASGS